MAMLFASATSFSGEKCSQKKVTQNAPCAPWKALFRLSTSPTSARTTSAPIFSSSFAFTDSVFRVNARTRYPPFLSFKIARHSPPPCAPVAPTTAMILLAMRILLVSSLSGSVGCIVDERAPALTRFDQFGQAKDSSLRDIIATSVSPRVRSGQDPASRRRHSYESGTRRISGHPNTMAAGRQPASGKEGPALPDTTDFRRSSGGRPRRDAMDSRHGRRWDSKLYPKGGTGHGERDHSRQHGAGKGPESRAGAQEDQRGGRSVSRERPLRSGGDGSSGELRGDPRDRLRQDTAAFRGAKQPHHVLPRSVTGYPGDRPAAGVRAACALAAALLFFF